MVIVNVVGFVMMIVAGALAGGFVHLFGSHHQTWIAIVSSPILFVLDIAYRRYRQSTLFGRAGGRLFFLPVWLISLLTLAGGILELVRGR
jgi:hypothetical protein